MAYRNILVHVGTDQRLEHRVRLACDLGQLFDATLVGLFVLPLVPLAMPAAAPGAVVGPEILEAQRQPLLEAAARARGIFETACESAGRPSEWYQEEGEPGHVVTLYARYFDLSVVGQEEREGIGALASQLPERVVLGSGRPVLALPYAGAFAQVGRRVLIAWNGSREAARAVGDALPLLARAEQVIVFEIDPPDGAGEAGAALARRLARHGVKAKAQHTVAGEVAAGEILLSALADHGADCLVMGAYGHSRLRELMLGGVTRTVLEHMTVPVLMAY